MVVCGYNSADQLFNDVEVISLDGSEEECMIPTESPVTRFGMGGAYFDGYPIVCGGLQSGNGGQKDCYKYNSQVFNYNSNKIKLISIAVYSAQADTLGTRQKCQLMRCVILSRVFILTVLTDRRLTAVS